MKKSIVSVFMLTLFFLLSCDFEAINQLIDKASAKLSDRDKKLKSLKYGQEVQEGHQDGGEEDFRDLENNIKNFAEESKLEDKAVNKGLFGSVDTINEVSVVNQDLYPYQRPIQIKEENLVPSTNEEKEAEKAIKAIEGILKDSGFEQLIGDVRQLRNEYEQLESSFYNIFAELKNRIMSYRIKDKTKRQELIRLYNHFNEERANIDMLRIQVDSGFNERRSAKLFFEKAKVTLRESIMERLKNKRISYWAKKVNSDLLAQKARREAENSLNQLESASIKLIEVIGGKKNIEDLMQKAKYSLVSLD